MTKLFVKKNDNVLIITGKEKGKQGKVLEVSTENNKVMVENVNIVSKHKKSRSQEDKGGIIKKPAFIESSNVMVVCPTCGKATRVARKLVDGKSARVCKKCGASLDKKYVKAVKTDKKKETKAATKNVASKK